ncbi:hypothetical protein R3I93_010664 [Phoxinus phoxinus]|uniref:Uncharacterized protein n=1 Tax=Phoxinus phoxinus TaxID=58324 RepID=A0AAN9CY43_9TELE
MTKYSKRFGVPLEDGLWSCALVELCIASNAVCAQRVRETLQMSSYHGNTYPM